MYEDLQHILEHTKQDVLFITRDWKVKLGIQEIPRITDKFGLGVQNEAGQKLTDFLSRDYAGHSKHTFPTIQQITLHMDITR